VKQFTSKTQKIGEIGEEKACMFLVKQGFSIVERNISNKFGEIDIVAKKKGEYYFFEVKTGRWGGFINPSENLTKEKLRKFFISVEHYCLINRISNYQVQGIVVLLKDNDTLIELIDLS
jgi:putative endonuclease